MKGWNPVTGKLVERTGVFSPERRGFGGLIAVFSQFKGWYGEEEGICSMGSQETERGPLGRKHRVGGGGDAWSQGWHGHHVGPRAVSVNSSSCARAAPRWKEFQCLMETDVRLLRAL